MRRAAGVLLGIALAAAPAAVAAQPSAQKSTLTAAGMAAAARAVLAPSDLGAGWQAAATAPDNPIDDCGAPEPSGVVEIGKAGSPILSRGTGGPFVSQNVFVYQTPAQAQQVWNAVAGRAARTCLVESVAGGSTQSLRFTVLHAVPFSVPLGGARTSAYRVIARVHTKLQTVRAYVDLILIARGQSLTEISYSAFLQPVARSLELSVARTLTPRL